MFRDRRGAKAPLILVLVLVLAAGALAAALRARGRIGAAAGAVGDRLRPGGGGRSGGDGRSDNGTPGQETYTCECGQAYRFSGAGRHRIFWPEGAEERDALTTAECVACERPLPAS